MPGFSYSAAIAGGWLALADGDRMLAIAPDGFGMADEAWTAIRSERGFERVIDLLMRGGFVSMPDFVLLEWRDATVRTLLRGPAVLEVTDAAGRHTQDGAGISTWTERTFSAVTSVEVSITGAKPTPGLAALPLGSGAAVIGGATITIGAGAVRPDAINMNAGEPHADELFAKQPDAKEPDAKQPDAKQPTPDEPDIADQPELADQTIVADTTVTATTVTAPNPDASDPDDSTIVRPRPGIAPPAPVAPAPAGPTSAAPTSAAHASPAPSPQLISAPPAGDHDGETVLTSEVQKLRAARGAGSGGAAPAREPAASVPTLTLADGSVERLDQAVVVGRSPSLSKVSGERMPRLIAVGAGDHDISRNHVRFAVEGGTVVVTDLHSRNGTVVVLPGRSPQKLRAGEPTAVIAGTLVDLGGGVTFSVGEP